jgi:putative restriction endonuclease
MSLWGAMIALSPTDNNWFNFLRKQAYVPLVNFWTPTDWEIHNINKGDYWYFVLKGSEPSKIDGGRRVLEYKPMVASKAW